MKQKNAGYLELKVKLFTPAAPPQFPNVIGPNGSNYDDESNESFWGGCEAQKMHPPYRHFFQCVS